METRVHISLEVSDLQKSLAFYSALFSRGPTKVHPDYANFRMESPLLHLALVHKPDRLPEPGPDGGSSRHYGIELFSDTKLSTWLESARSAGLEPRTEEQVTCCYAVADKFWARDPDGHEWEFWVRKDEADAMHEKTKEEPSRTCCAPACCAPSES